MNVDTFFFGGDVRNSVSLCHFYKKTIHSDLTKETAMQQNEAMKHSIGFISPEEEYSLTDFYL